MTYRTVGPSYLRGFRHAAVADECLFDGQFCCLVGVFHYPTPAFPLAALADCRCFSLRIVKISRVSRMTGCRGQEDWARIFSGKNIRYDWQRFVVRGSWFGKTGVLGDWNTGMLGKTGHRRLRITPSLHHSNTVSCLLPTRPLDHLTRLLFVAIRPSSASADPASVGRRVVSY